MTYARKRYSNYRRRYRTKRTLSTRNIYNNKGSRAQANQINSLKKRINFVYNQCKPEIKTIESNPTGFTLSRTPFLGNDPFFLYQVEMPELGVEDNARIGNACNILDSHIFLYFKMGWQSDVNYQLNDLGQAVCSTIRLVPFIVKAPSDLQPDPNEILTMSLYSSNFAQYNMNPIGPFNEGVSGKYLILGDYRYNMSMDDKPVITSKIKIKGSKIKRYIATQYSTVGKAAIYVLITWNGLAPVSYQGETLATPSIVLTISDKTAYTDP